jgi:hypothetical protein
VSIPLEELANEWGEQPPFWADASVIEVGGAD